MNDWGRDPTANQETGEAAPLGEEEVRAWLLARPDFFGRHPDLLPQALPSGGKVVDLETGRLEYLRRQNQAIQQQLDEIVERVRGNEAIYHAFHAIQVEMALSETWEELTLKTTTTLEMAFELPRVTIALSSGEEGVWPAGREWPESLRGRFFIIPRRELWGVFGDPPKPVVRVGREGINRALFFGEATYRVRSELLLPLIFRGEMLGSLNLGGELPSRFMPGHSNDLVENLAECLALFLRKRLPEG
ncbi:MAG: DUF484 family protein [Magnetococcales bacterium]|nr:DUF484 family protein [Magnetococcales bacterium]